MKKLMTLLMTLLTISCTQSSRPPEAVSGPENCRKFNLKQTKSLADKKDLLSIRMMRDYYLDCVIKDNKSDVVHWGKLAAEVGTDEDRETYDFIIATYGEK